MATEDLKKKTLSGLFWQFAHKVLGQVISFGISVVLARILMPEEFGVVALAGMFIVLLGIFVDSGFGAALIQKKDADDLDFCTIFWTQTTFASIIYIIIFILAPWFSSIFHTEQLTIIIRVLALGMILGTLGGIQCVIVSKQMAFKSYFYRTLIGTTTSGVIGIYLAYQGWGVWALVVQHLSATILNTLTVFFQIRWIPHFRFSFERFKSLFNIGSKFMLSSLIGTGFYQLRGYLIGWKYLPADLAYYNRGEGVPHIFTRNIDASINSVLFPVISKLQDDRSAVKKAIRRSMRTSSYTLMPMLLGLAAIADKLVIILYTEKWAAAIPYMQVFCFSECFGILNTANMQALKGIGEAGTLLKLEIYKKPVMVAILIVAMFISPFAIAAGMTLYGVYALIINAYPNKKFIKYSITEQIKDIGENFIVALIMATIVYLIGRIDLNIYLLITIQIIVGICVYIAISEIKQIESWIYIKNNFGSLLKRK